MCSMFLASVALTFHFIAPSLPGLPLSLCLLSRGLCSSTASHPPNIRYHPEPYPLSVTARSLALPLTPSLLIQEAALCGGGSAGRAVRNWKGGRHHKPPTNKVGAKTGERERARLTSKWPFMYHVPNIKLLFRIH